MIPFHLTLIQSLKQNTVSLISLIVAIMALTVNAQRANQTEYQRNIRSASFTILHELSQLQLLIDIAHYDRQARGDISQHPITGWARVNYIQDLSIVVPEPLPQAVADLHSTWTAEIDIVGLSRESPEFVQEKSLQSNQRISAKIAAARASVKQVLLALE